MSTLEKVNRFLGQQSILPYGFDMPSTFIELFEILDENEQLRSAAPLVNDHFDAIGDFRASSEFQKEFRDYIKLRNYLLSIES